MGRFVCVCAAGAAGTGVRYLIALWATRRFGTGFPIGTLIVNIVGCFLISVVVQAAVSQAWSPTLRAIIAVGFLGGLTTYSSFNAETLRLFEDGASAAATLNALLTIGGGALAGWLGLALARHWVPS